MREEKYENLKSKCLCKSPCKHFQTRFLGSARLKHKMKNERSVFTHKVAAVFSLVPLDLSFVKCAEKLVGWFITKLFCKPSRLFINRQQSRSDESDWENPRTRQISFIHHQIHSWIKSCIYYACAAEKQTTEPASEHPEKKTFTRYMANTQLIFYLWKKKNLSI